jgi:hypothetical protein
MILPFIILLSGQVVAGELVTLQSHDESGLSFWRASAKFG